MGYNFLLEPLSSLLFRGAFVMMKAPHINRFSRTISSRKAAISLAASLCIGGVMWGGESGGCKPRRRAMIVSGSSSMIASIKRHFTLIHALCFLCRCIQFHLYGLQMERARRSYTHPILSQTIDNQQPQSKQSFHATAQSLSRPPAVEG